MYRAIWHTHMAMFYISRHAYAMLRGITSVMFVIVSVPVYVVRQQRGTWSSAPPLTTPWPCGRTWSRSLCTSTVLPRTLSTPLTCMPPRLSPAPWLTRSASTLWWTSPPVLLAWPSSAPRTSAGPSPAWQCSPQRGCSCWAQRTGPSGYWPESLSLVVQEFSFLRSLSLVSAVAPTRLRMRLRLWMRPEENPQLFVFMSFVWLNCGGSRYSFSLSSLTQQGPHLESLKHCWWPK